MQDSKRTVWIAFEGGDGSGKTTIVNRVVDRLREAGVNVHQSRAPGGTFLGHQLRQMLVDHQPEMGALTEELIHAADMAQLCYELSDLPESVQVIVTDRSVLSSYVYSTYGKQNPRDWENMFYLTERLRTPDAVILLDVDPVVGKRRSSAARGKDVIAAYDNESLEFYNRIQQGFHAILGNMSPKTSVRLDTTNYSLDEVEWLTMIEVWRILANLGVPYPEQATEAFTVTTT